MKIEGDKVTFSSGREWYANGGTIGLKRWEAEFDGDIGFAVSEGWDGGLPAEDLTPPERAELADFMIAEWTAFKLAIPKTEKE